MYRLLRLPPKRIVLDVDDTEAPAHASKSISVTMLFCGDCFLPLHVDEASQPPDHDDFQGQAFYCAQRLAVLKRLSSPCAPPARYAHRLSCDSHFASPEVMQ